jgi:predicted DNA binding CopG/RHH family protein
MKKEQQENQDIQLSELERLIGAFREEFKAKSTDVTISLQYMKLSACGASCKVIP